MIDEQRIMVKLILPFDEQQKSTRHMINQLFFKNGIVLHEDEEEEMTVELYSNTTRHLMNAKPFRHNERYSDNEIDESAEVINGASLLITIGDYMYIQDVKYMFHVPAQRDHDIVLDYMHRQGEPRLVSHHDTNADAASETIVEISEDKYHEHMVKINNAVSSIISSDNMKPQMVDHIGNHLITNV